MSINKLILTTMCASLLGVFTFQDDAHAYRNTFGTLDHDRCAIFDDSERPEVSLPYGSGLWIPIICVV